jgi:hypothetical protein
MATRYEERPREREQVPEEELRLEPMLADRDYEKLYGMRAWLRDRVRLAPVFAGVFIAFATTIFLTAFGIWIGIISAPITPAGGLPVGLAAGLGVWAGVSTWLALWLGGWYAAHMAGVAGRIDGILNGVAVWGLFITGGVLLSSFTSLLGVGSLVTFTIGGGSTLDLLRALNLSALATVTPDQAAAIRAAVSDAALFVWIGTLVGAGFSVLGGWLGARSRKVNVPPPGERERTSGLERP